MKTNCVKIIHRLFCPLRALTEKFAEPTKKRVYNKFLSSLEIARYAKGKGGELLAFESLEKQFYSQLCEPRWIPMGDKPFGQKNQRTFTKDEVFIGERI